MNYVADVYDKNANLLGNKIILSYNNFKYISDWRSIFYDNINKPINYCIIVGSSMQSNNNTFLQIAQKIVILKKVW